MNLYQISTEYVEILNDLYDDEGQINTQALVRLEQNSNAMENKAVALASFIQNMSAEQEAIKKAKKDMDDRHKRLEKRIEDLKGYLQVNMQKRDMQKISCPYFEIKLKKCPKSVNIINPEAIPSEYLRTKTEVLPDKIKMLADMKEGVVIEGVELQQRLTVDIK